MGIVSETFSVEVFPAGLWNLDSTCPLIKFDEIDVFLKTEITIIFERGANRCRFLTKLFLRGCQNRIIHVQKSFQNKVFCYKKCHFSINSWHRLNCSRVPGIFNPAGLSKQHATCMWEKFEQNFFELKFFFSSITDLVRKIIHLWWENFRQNWQISLLGVNSDLYGKTFLAFFKIIFWQGATKLQLLVVFWGGRQHCNLHIQKNSSMEKTIQKIILFYPFSQNDRKLSGLLAIVLACLSKLHARSSYKLFEDLKTTKKLKIFYPLCSLKGIFPFFDEFFLGGFKICLQRIRRKTLNEIFLYKKSVFYHIRTRSGDFRPL